jgi:hypothetical protein
MEVQWAGNPYEKKKGVGAYLQPRASFRRWSEHVVGRSRKWTEDQGKFRSRLHKFCPRADIVPVESAAVLSTLYGRFIEVWRQKEAIVQRNRMTRLLIRNAGHEGQSALAFYMIILIRSYMASPDAFKQYYQLFRGRIKGSAR